MKKVLSFLLFLLFIIPGSAQIIEPVHWSVSKTTEKGNNVSVVLTANIDAGWHLYDTEIAQGGPRPTVFRIDGVDSLEVSLESGTPTTIYDENFMLDLTYYSTKVSWALTFDRSYFDDKNSFKGEVEFMVCNDESCLPPTVFDFEVNSPALQDITQTAQETTNSSSRSLWTLFLLGLLGGLLAIFTPCVWPIIPMTVSFFMKRSANGKAIHSALIYGLSIIVIYLTLGILVTLIFGASALNDLATNAIVNIIFFAILVIFAFSFFGAFEITLPSSWSTKIDKKARSTTGILSILLMAFTLVLVSFSCTGPIIGTLLVEAAGNSLLAPAIGMLGFAVALALPFSLFAMFPQWMKKLPKSGGWMDSFKVVLAFLELALSLKFLSVADLAYGWHILDREVFISLWIIIFGLLGLYLLGIFHFKHEEKKEGISVFRFMLAVLSLSFTIYMVPGLWGAPLKSISAFVPPMTTQDWVSGQGKSTEDNHLVGDLDAAILKAQNEGKNVLIDFSGYGCVNCRKMEAKVLTAPQVEQALKNYVLVTLIVDDKTPLNEPIEVDDNGKTRMLKTIGDYNSYLQRSRFKANAQPYYVKLSATGEQIGTAYSYDEDIDKFVQWLN